MKKLNAARVSCCSSVRTAFFVCACVQVFAFGSEGPPWMPPHGFKWQLVEAKKEEKKKEEKKADEKKDEKKKEKLPVSSTYFLQPEP